MCKTNWSYICSEWRIWIKPLLILLYTLFAIIIIPFLIVDSVKDGFTQKKQLILIGGLFVLAAIPITIWHITQHLIHFTKPILQKHIIRILWMVPIYALNAWIGLIFPDHSIYMDSIRECYEAYVIYNFMMYLLNYLNLEMDLEASLEDKPQVRHIFPLCCMRPWEMGREFIHNCKHGILQYTVVRPITTFISMICELNGVYGEASFSAKVAFPYIILANNLSQFIAMYCLVLFYQANKLDLRPMRPIPKFLCIKAVIFFSFFQGVIITVLVYFGYIKNIFGKDDENIDKKSLASELQNFLICIEMFLAALAHIFSFPHKPYHLNLPENWTSKTWSEALVSMLDIRDFNEDVFEHLGVVSSSLSRRFRGRSSYQVPRGYSSNNETQNLISPLKNNQNEIDSMNSNYLNRPGPSYQQYYGTIENQIDSTAKSNFAINIRTKDTKEYSPHKGAPTLENYFEKKQSSPQDNSLSIKHETDTSSQSETISTSKGINIKKSDSTVSDWLSTPTDEVLGIDVKGIEKDHISYFCDQKL